MAASSFLSIQIKFCPVVHQKEVVRLFVLIDLLGFVFIILALQHLDHLLEDLIYIKATLG